MRCARLRHWGKPTLLRKIEGGFSDIRQGFPPTHRLSALTRLMFDDPLNRCSAEAHGGKDQIATRPRDAETQIEERSKRIAEADIATVINVRRVDHDVGARVAVADQKSCPNRAAGRHARSSCRGKHILETIVEKRNCSTISGHQSPDWLLQRLRDPGKSQGIEPLKPPSRSRCALNGRCLKMRWWTLAGSNR